MLALTKVAAPHDKKIQTHSLSKLSIHSSNGYEGTETPSSIRTQEYC